MVALSETGAQGLCPHVVSDMTTVGTHGVFAAAAACSVYEPWHRSSLGWKPLTGGVHHFSPRQK